VLHLAAVSAFIVQQRVEKMLQEPRIPAVEYGEG